MVQILERYISYRPYEDHKIYSCREKNQQLKYTHTHAQIKKWDSRKGYWILNNNRYNQVINSTDRLTNICAN